jgi:hypothetical protein
MTVLRRDPGHINNYFNELESGLGHRGSSFSDIDGVSHDGPTNRFLFREFKQDGEPLSAGQRRLLEGLALLPGCRCWYVMVRDRNTLVWSDMRSGEIDIISPQEYRYLVSDWWSYGGRRP